MRNECLSVYCGFFWRRRVWTTGGQACTHIMFILLCHWSQSDADLLLHVFFSFSFFPQTALESPLTHIQQQIPPRTLWKNQQTKTKSSDSVSLSLLFWMTSFLTCLEKFATWWLSGWHLNWFEPWCYTVDFLHGGWMFFQCVFSGH